ncbi:metallophosphoesterase family protein [uncultured Prevotella sp.]|uniref:metallophosphoesterase family protein n=1 Tax=uncultured Prevotella sp. TaxID=159272 RepID=UPI0025E9DC27|nr:metallophosphoesterase family protein [uncultured Prevotella sp.]
MFISFRFTILISLLCFSLTGTAQKLRFNRNGEFKIVQFTDVHYKIHDARSNAAIKCIDAVLEAEQPDLVVLTGDIVYSAPADSGLVDVLSRVAKAKVPFALVFGNHDDEHGLTRSQLYDVARKVPYCLLPDRGDVASPDYTLSIGSHDGKQTAAVLYMIDSHSYSKLDGIKGYDWIKHEQISWYREQSQQFAAKNGGKPLPSLAFFHIPLPEYGYAAADQSAIISGTRMEAACAPKINSGMFTAMREQGDVMATFVGHDHDNDYCVMHHNLLLCYGRFTGGNTEYNHLKNGARVIVMKEGERKFETYIRERSGQVVDRTQYPDSYVKDNWKARPIEE